MVGLAECPVRDWNQSRTPSSCLEPVTNSRFVTGTSHELKVPSGYQTGIKIVKGFSIAVSQTTELLLDFDAAKSVVQAGKSGKWLLKPTIKVLESMENLVSGVIDDGVNPIAGAMVSAQFYDPDALDPEI